MMMGYNSCIGIHGIDLVRQRDDLGNCAFSNVEDMNFTRGLLVLRMSSLELRSNT